MENTKTIENTPIKPANLILKILSFVVPIILLAVAATTIFNNDFWYDEAWSIEMARHSIGDILRIDAMDVHPPLYYIILNIGNLLLGGLFGGNLIITGKLVSFIPYVIAVLLGFTIIRKRYGDLTAFFFNVFILGMPNMIKYSVEIRMYSWSMLFVLLAFLQFSKIASETEVKIKNVILLALFSVLASYTFYFAFIACIVLYITLIIVCLVKGEKPRTLKALISFVASLVLYIPWLPKFFSLLANKGEHSWMEQFTEESFKETLRFPFENEGFLQYVFVAIGLIAVANAVMLFTQKKYDALVGFIALYGTVIIGVVLSLLIRPIFIARYMMCGMACLWLGIAISIANLTNQTLKYILLVVCILLSAYNLNNFIEEEKEKTEIAEKTVQILKDNVTPDTVIVDNHGQLHYVIASLFPNNETNLVYSAANDDTWRTDEASKEVYSLCKIADYENTSPLQKLKGQGKRILIIDTNDNLNRAVYNEGWELKHLDFHRLGEYWFHIYMVERT